MNHTPHPEIERIVDEFNLQPLLDIAEGKRPLDDDWNVEATKLHNWLLSHLSHLVDTIREEERGRILAAFPEHILDERIFPYEKMQETHTENDGYNAAIRKLHAFLSPSKE